MVYNHQKLTDFSSTECMINFSFSQCVLVFPHLSTMNTLIYNEKLLKIQMIL